MEIKEKCPINRIILIGNGFDLAHGLQTSYQHFIDNFWNKIGTTCSTTYGFSLDNDFVKITVPEMQTLARVFPASGTPYTYDKLSTMVRDYKREGRIITFIVKNSFLKYISKLRHDAGWVDIENAYYQKLKECIKTHQDEIERHHAVEKLNREFEDIKNALEDYLVEETKSKHLWAVDTIDDCITETFGYKELNSKGQKVLSEYEWNYLQQLKAAQETGNETLADWQERLLESSKNLTQEDIAQSLWNTEYPERMHAHPGRILFLNFNYTTTDLPYLSSFNINTLRINAISIHIHGFLKDLKNPIIFGYGDELDENYKELERANDNLFLQNIKSVRYLFTNNYTRLSAFAESAPYQVYVFGHSCGNSDRTLLHYLFEHPNCVSIKPFYHKDKENDNYMDIISNITRAFNDKHALRTRVVNRSNCKTLPQKKIHSQTS